MGFDGSAAVSSGPAVQLATSIGVGPGSDEAAGWWQARDASQTLPSLLSRLSSLPIGMALPHGAQALQLRVSSSGGTGLRLWVVLSSSTDNFLRRPLGVLRP